MLLRSGGGVVDPVDSGRSQLYEFEPDARLRSARNVLHSRFGDNALKGWLRSHPEVAAAHHPDLADQP